MHSMDMRVQVHCEAVTRENLSFVQIKWYILPRLRRGVLRINMYSRLQFG